MFFYYFFIIIFVDRFIFFNVINIEGFVFLSFFDIWGISLFCYYIFDMCRGRRGRLCFLGGLYILDSLFENWVKVKNIKIIRLR